ncbi:MAG: hypothetical protein HY518_02520 [Candidatus Aenigmarchaeota archaeon]|nr:hypothetical protein [Candidatus Aenigmarchaeota archaeon]
MAERYQAISFDTSQIDADIDAGKKDGSQLIELQKRYLNRLVEEGFEVLVDGCTMIAGFPPSILVGGDRSRPIKDRAYEIADELGLGPYVGSGDFYTLHKLPQAKNRLI